ncbi:MAG: hypothetical protein AB1414_09890 [bacterium]
MDIFKLADLVRTQETVQKEPDTFRRKPAPEISFEEAIKHPKEFAPTKGQETVISKGEDKLTLSAEGKTAYEITKLILAVLKTEDIREDKVMMAKELLNTGRLLTRQGILEITARKLIKGIGI